MKSKPTTAPAVGSAIFVFALAIRALWWPRIFTESGVIPPHGSDEFLHLRRIWYSVVRFPELLEFDAYVNHPIGGEIITPPGFDLAVAALARILVGAHDQGAVEMVAAWVPAVLGAAAAVTAFALASRVFGLGAGIVSGVLLALLPGHYYTSQVGWVDHHVAVSLLSALLALGAVSAQSKPAGRGWPVLAVTLGLGAAAILSVSPGALLHLALFQGLAFIWMLQARDVARAISRAWHLALIQGLAALAIAPYAVGLEWKQYGGWSPFVLCNFQPAWLAGTAIACAALALLWSRTRWGGDPRRRWLAAAALAGTALVAALVTIPELSASIDQAAGWFTEEEANYLSDIDEIQPLFAKTGGADKSDASMHLTRLIYAYPLALAWLFLSAVRSRRPDRWLVFAWGTAFYVAVLSQLRFLSSFSLPFAIAMGGALTAAVGALRRRLAQRQQSVRIAACCVLLGLGVFVALPSANFYSPKLAFWWHRSETHDLTHRYVRSMAYRTIASWLKENSPKTAGYLDGARPPEYGVLAVWDMGHLVRYIAERPQVQDNFGIYGGREGFEAARRYFAARDEGEARSILAQLGVRYVLVDRGFLGRAADSFARQLYVQRERAGDAGERIRLELPPFEHHRLAMETPPKQPRFPHVMLYEIVRGAQVEGRATPGSRVQIRLLVLSPERAGAFAYRQQTTTNAAGIYRFVLPYATGVEEPLRSGPRYQLQCGGEPASLVVTEQAVDEGHAIAGPALTCVVER
jgi:dolichyl-diphosphooligosaccharide--protein glycosyltransferase